MAQNKYNANNVEIHIGGKKIEGFCGDVTLNDGEVPVLPDVTITETRPPSGEPLGGLSIELMRRMQEAIFTNTEALMGISGRERQQEAVREENERRDRILRALRQGTGRIPGVILPDFMQAFRDFAEENRGNQSVPERVFVGDRVEDEEDRQRKKKEQKRIAEEEFRKAEEHRQKYSYQPGMAISEFVSRQIQVSQGERLKWLRTFQNCVLPEEVRETIEEALTTVMMAKKFDEWGINESFEKGLTNSILLYGPPGTGKTMIAESFAAVLGKDLLKVSNADLASQIPGEAERNISKNFKLAKDNNAVLMFDECDSLLYDRNAVGMIMASEINHLLTEIERFDGVCILTTNRLERLDPALQRRIIAKVELPLPNEEARVQIWKNLMPKKAPIHQDVDVTMLAKLELSGGEIKNVILTAIRKAVAKNSPVVTAEHFAVACRSVFKAKKDFEGNRPQVVPHEDVTQSVGMDLVRNMERKIEKVRH